MLTLTTKQLEIVGTHQFCEAVFSSSTAAAVTVKDICYSIGNDISSALFLNLISELYLSVNAEIENRAMKNC